MAVTDGNRRALKVRDPFMILVADDDERIRECLSEILEKEGYRILTVGNGLSALEVVKRKRIHVGILDMHMPDLSGVEIISTFSSMHRIIPAILVTADRSKETRMKAMGAGAFTVVTKPFTTQIVQRTVRQVIHKYYENAS